MPFSEIFRLPTKPAPEITCLHQGVEALDLATIKDFFHFYIATSYGRIVAKPTVDSINTSAEWFFAGFTRVTGTEIYICLIPRPRQPC